MNGKTQPPDASPRSDYVFTEQVGYLLRRAYHRHLAIFQTGELQLTSVQFSTLCALRDAGPLSQGELVKVTGIDQATIRGIVERLKRSGFVTFLKDRADARKVIYAATPAGLRVLDSAIPHAVRVTEATYGALNPAERVALVFTLQKMLGDDAG